MGRERASRGSRPRFRGFQSQAELARVLEEYDVDGGFARDVAKTYFTEGPERALVQLFAGGWEIVRHWENGSKGQRVERLSIERVLGDRKA